MQSILEFQNENNNISLNCNSLDFQLFNHSMRIDNEYVLNLLIQNQRIAAYELPFF
jgi:hypothetical protein